MLFLKNTILNFFVNYGYFISKRTEINEIQQLLKLLYPIKTDKELIRIGDKGDGGYLIPDDLLGIKALFSPGVGAKVDFEKSIYTRGIKKIFLADYSVSNPNITDFDFIKKFVGLFNDEQYIKFDEWVEHRCSEGDMILQMDIEGGEYEIILGMKESLLKRFRIIVVEFHNLHLIYLREFFPIVYNVFKKLSQFFWIVHIHPNNASFIVRYKKSIEIPSVMEFTFYRKDRAKKIGYVNTFPHYLDTDCVKGRKTIILPRCFYKTKN